MSTPWLSDAEINEICAGMTQNAGKARRLRAMGLTVNIKPNGRPLVLRSNIEAVLGGMPAMQSGQAPERQPVGPNLAALYLAFGGSR